MLFGFAWDIFCDVLRLNLPRTVRLLNNKTSFRLIIKKLLVLECRNCDVKLRNF